MEFKEFPNEFSLRAQVQVLCIHTDAVLKFAEEITTQGAVLKFAEEITTQGAEHLSDDDKAIYDSLTDYLDRACY